MSGIILKVEGILTARGGGTSHAAVTIPQLNKVGVVGFSKLHVYENEAFSQCENQIIRGGDYISIDGWTGAVYFGKHDIEKEESYKITLVTQGYFTVLGSSVLGNGIILKNTCKKSPGEIPGLLSFIIIC